MSDTSVINENLIMIRQITNSNQSLFSMTTYAKIALPDGVDCDVNTSYVSFITTVESRYFEVPREMEKGSK